MGAEEIEDDDEPFEEKMLLTAKLEEQLEVSAWLEAAIRKNKVQICTLQLSQCERTSVSTASGGELLPTTVLVPHCSNFVNKLGCILNKPRKNGDFLDFLRTSGASSSYTV